MSKIYKKGDVVILRQRNGAHFMPRDKVTILEKSWRRGLHYLAERTDGVRGTVNPSDIGGLKE